MNFYQIEARPDEVVSHYATLSEAHQIAKTHDRDQVRVLLVDIPTDKGNVLRLLNNRSAAGVQVLKRWRLSVRGALVELGEGQE